MCGMWDVCLGLVGFTGGFIVIAPIMKGQSFACHRKRVEFDYGSITRS